MRDASDILSCALKDFPCTYLGLPLTIHKPTKNDLLPLIDKVVDYLPGWKASLMNRSGRLIMVRVVLTAVPIYLMIAMDLPKALFGCTQIHPNPRGLGGIGVEFKPTSI